ncbi:MAG: hypothetical protein HYY37_06725 [Candidatus Aenigmarchaeota archaeon]|nr:hypothetical protein [Candidatus Aenigmarchaeota archaeon]
MLNNPADLFFAAVQIIAALLLWLKIAAPDAVVMFMAFMLVLSAIIDIFT